jgi:hypothetical protein
MNNKKDRFITLGRKTRPTKQVDLTFPNEDGTAETWELDLKPASSVTHSTIAQRAGATQENGGTPLADLLVAETAVACTYLRGTDTLAFSRDDVPALLSMGPAFDPLAKAVLEMLTPKVDSIPSESSATAS